MTPQTLKELLEGSAARYGDRIAFSLYQGESFTYREINARATRVREMLLESGLSAGDRVALLSGNMPNWAACYLGAASAGMVVVPILPDFSTSELEKILAHSEARALMVSDRLFSKLPDDATKQMRVVIRTKNLGVIASHPAGTPGVAKEPLPEDLAVVIYTSGTTSDPKGVMLTHAALCAQIDLAAGIFPVSKEDVFLSVLPLSHTYECSIGMIYPFAHGAHVVYLDRTPTVGVLLPALEAVRPTVMLIVPLIIEKIYRGRVLKKFNSTALWRFFYRRRSVRCLMHRVVGRRLMRMFGGRLRFLGIGGAKLDEATERFLNEAHFPYAIGYGLTETAPLLAGAAPSQVRVGSTGPAAPGVRLRIENVDPKTGLGEIVACTPAVMKGYFHNEKATKEVFTADGWFRTGDIGCFSDDGWLYIRGRLKNMIVGPGGENIYPEDIESVLNSHVYISDSVVTEREGRLVALVNFDKEALEAKFEAWREDFDQWKERARREIAEFVNSRVSKSARISEVVEEKQEFVKTPTHKIRRFLYTRMRK